MTEITRCTLCTHLHATDDDCASIPKPVCSICDEPHAEQADCVHHLRGELHYARKKSAELKRDLSEMEIGYNALRHAQPAG
jgi:hypothetical protein